VPATLLAALWSALRLRGDAANYSFEVRACAQLGQASAF
jgi:hypothetical protein